MFPIFNYRCPKINFIKWLKTFSHSWIFKSILHILQDNINSGMSGEDTRQEGGLHKPLKTLYNDHLHPIIIKKVFPIFNYRGPKINFIKWLKTFSLSWIFKFIQHILQDNNINSGMSGEDTRQEGGRTRRIIPSP